LARPRAADLDRASGDNVVAERTHFWQARRAKDGTASQYDTHVYTVVGFFREKIRQLLESRLRRVPSQQIHLVLHEEPKDEDRVPGPAGCNCSVYLPQVRDPVDDGYDFGVSGVSGPQQGCRREVRRLQLRKRGHRSRRSHG
jgi:hypothetical protein